MIRATIPRMREHRSSDRVCFRCGIEWSDPHKRWPVRNAPCEECRIMLRREKVDLSEYRKPSVAA